ncbi:hypothetical protein LR032_01725 [Candidatus Bipolaricaulota bacterium]|nr:hypothetical protein [Candidatus Bipolaricaulota bacterium]
MPLEIGATLAGNVVEVTGEGLLVSLDDDTSGLVPTSISLPLAAMEARFSPGMSVAIEIVASGENGRYILCCVPTSESEEVSSFDREFHRLNHVLTHCSVPQQEPVRDSPAVVEEKIEAWIAEVEKGLSQLRKHRGARLSQDFYSKKS